MSTGYLACAGAAVAGLHLAAQALTGQHTLLGVASLAWPGAVVLLVGALAAAASVRPWGHRLPAAPVTVSLGLVAALSLAGSCFVLLNLIELALTGSVTDRDGNSDWATFGERLGAALLAVLFTAAALTWRRQAGAQCPRCGEPHPPGPVLVVHPGPQAAARSVRWTAYAGCAVFAPYLTMHGLHAIGRMPSTDQVYSYSGDSPLLLFAGLAIGLVGPAIFLALGLVQRWGMVFPRWTLWLAGRRVPRLLPLVPVWLVAPTLTLYGAGSFGYALAAGHDHLWGLGGAASLAFGGYGCGLAVAVLSYQRRTRPRCVPIAGPGKAVHGAGRFVRGRLR